jgi:hypothetical protein
MPDPAPANDDTFVQKVLLKGLAVIPLVAWLVFIVWAGLLDHNQTTPPDLPEGLRLVGTASGAALATIAGAFLGLKPDEVRIKEAARLPNLSVNALAAVAYFVGLIVAVVIWIFDSNRAYAADVIQTALATLFGFAIGALKAATTPKS